MTKKEEQIQKIEFLETTIRTLYEKEGRSISYISKLLEIDRGILGKEIKNRRLIKANVNHLTPSVQKFINKNKPFILSRLSQQVAISDIAKELNVSRDKIYYVIERDKELTEAKIQFENNKVNIKKESGAKRNYFEELDGEEWKPVLGFSGYFVSNKGRFKKYLRTYDCYSLLKPTPNSRNGRLYVSLITEEGKRKNLMAARIVGHAFCNGYSKEKNTIDHLDGDITNNDASNLEWVSQKENNTRAYKNGKAPVIHYSKNGKFKKIVLNDKYEFKTIRSLANFLGVSESQAHRYISGETSCQYVIKLIY